MAQVAFFGVGLMGEPMVNRLLDAGHEVTVVAHRSRLAIERVVARGATEARTPSEAVKQTDMAITMLPTADEVEEVFFGAGRAAASMAPAYIVIDMGTSLPSHTRRLAGRMKEAGGRFLDAPVTGGTRGAQEGTLTIMVGGDEETLAAARPILSVMGAQLCHFGDVGAGHQAKLVQNMIGIIASAGIAEGFVLAAAAGLDVEQFFHMLSSSTSNSPALQFMVSKVMAREFEKVSFRLDMASKDIRQATAMARDMGVPLLTANGAAELLQLSRALGFGSQDATAMIRGLETILRVEVRRRGKE